MITLKKLEEAVGIRRQMEALEKRLSLLLGGAASGSTTRQGRRMSASARAKLAAAAKARWAKRRGRTIPSTAKRRGGLTPAGRRRLSELMKARWAARRKATAKK